MDRDNWLIDKTCKHIWALSGIVDHLNTRFLYEHADKDERATRESDLANYIFMAVDKATKMLAYETGIEWEAVDRDLILAYGQIGYDHLLRRYGLAEQLSHPIISDIPFHQSRPLGSLDVLEESWIFATFDVTRPLQGEVIWNEVAVDEGQQRKMLAQAFEQAYRYALCPQGWLLIVGPRDAGKSHLAGAIIREALKAGMSPRYQSAPDITAFDIQDASSWEEAEWRAGLQRLKDADLLVIDNIDYRNDLVLNNTLALLLQIRSWGRRPTVLVSIQSRDNLPMWLRNKVTEIAVIASSYRRLPKK